MFNLPNILHQQSEKVGKPPKILANILSIKQKEEHIACPEPTVKLQDLPFPPHPSLLSKTLKRVRTGAKT